MSSQQLTGKCNTIHVITYHRYMNIVRKNLRESISVYNQIRHIKTIRKKIISLPKKPPITYHIGDLVKSLPRANWYDSLFPNHEKMENPLD